MDKSGRLQLRINPKLKRWFYNYARTRGGMSKLIQDQLKQWKDEEDEGDGRTEERARD